MNDSDLPTLKFPIPWGASAGPGYIRPIPVDSQIGIEDGAASLTDGFPPVTMTPVGAGGLWPFGQDANGIFFEVTGWLRWVQAGAPIGYDGSFSTAIGGYPKGAVIAGATAGSYWYSQVNANPTDPDSGGSDWVACTILPLFGRDTGSKNAIAIAMDPDEGTNDFYVGKSIVIYKINTTNDSTVTVNLNGNGNQPLVHVDGTPIAPGELPGHGMLTVVLDSSGNFQLQSASVTRSRLSANLTLYVDGATGNDSNNGLTIGTPFLTLQRAWDVAFQNYDLNGNVINVSIADFAYTAGISAGGRLVGAKRTSSLRFFSASGNPVACTVTSTGNTINASDGAQLALQDIRVSSSGGNAINVGGGGARIDIISGVDFGTTSGSHIVITDGGRFNVQGAYTISGNATYHYNWTTNAILTVTPTSATVITLSGTPTFTAFALAKQGGQALFQNTTFSGGANGQRYNASLNAVINTQGGGASYLPGSTAGAVATGGQYA